MLFTILRLFLAWASARFIKKSILKRDFGKFVAILLSIFWATAWSILEMYLIETFLGKGAHRPNSLVPNILFTSIVVYYALIIQEFGVKPKAVEDSALPNNQGLAKVDVLLLKARLIQFLKKMALVKSVTRVVISLKICTVFLVVMFTILALIHIGDWSKAKQAHLNSLASSHSDFCWKFAVHEVEGGYPEPKKLYRYSELKEYYKYLERLKQKEKECKNPSSLILYTWDTYRDSCYFFIVTSFYLAVIVFLALLAGRSLILESHVGWKRLSIVIGAAAFVFLSFILIQAIAVEEPIIFIKEDDIVIWLCTLFMAPFIAIVLILKGKLLIKWVKEGFSEG